jgi:hypothetical protein
MVAGIDNAAIVLEKRSASKRAWRHPIAAACLPGV